MLKESSLETATNSFLNKENDLQNKIEELERRFETYNQNAANFCGDKFQKVSHFAVRMVHYG